jgi:hypothetical protein
LTLSLVLTILCLQTSDAAEDSVDAGLLAMGSAGAADATSNSAIAINPGLIGLHTRYDFEGFFHYGPGGGLHWGGSAMDSQTAKGVAFGLVYSGDSAQPAPATPDLPGWKIVDTVLDNKKRYHDITTAIAVPFARQRISIGLNGTVALYDHDLGGRGSSGNMDAGLGVKPVRWLTLGVVGRNLLPIPYERPLGLKSGVRIEEMKVGALEVDFDWNKYERRTELSSSMGGELVTGTTVFRLGGRYHSDDPSTVSWGLGIRDRGVELCYGMSVPLDSNQALTGMVNGISLKMNAEEMSGNP